MIGKFTFQAPANILFEPGASRKIDELVASYGAKRVMLVTDKGVRGVGLTKGAEASLAEAGIEVVVFDDVVADPPSQVVEAAVAACEEGLSRCPGSPLLRSAHAPVERARIRHTFKVLRGGA